MTTLAQFSAPTAAAEMNAMTQLVTHSDSASVLRIQAGS